ncbi:MAG: phosphotransferase [Caldilineaceae bacterium]
MRTNKGSLLAQGRAAEIYAWGDHHVLKLFRRSGQAAVEQELVIGRLAYTHGIRTPQAFEVIESDGRLGVVYERVQGPSLLTALTSQPWRLVTLMRGFAELHATLHQVSVPSLRAGRSKLEWDIPNATMLPVNLQLATLNILQKFPDDDKLCHGDFHPDNIIVAPDGLVVIDWANSVRGAPLADVAKTALLLQIGQLPAGAPLAKRASIALLRRLVRTIYLTRYFQVNPLPRQAWRRWSAVIAAARAQENIPGEQASLVNFIQTQLRKEGIVA